MPINGHILTHSTPLVRGRSSVQSCPAAPLKPFKYGLFSTTEKPHLTFRDRTGREHDATDGAAVVQIGHVLFQEDSVSQARKKTRTIKLPDYGYADLNRLAEAENAFGAMTDEERERALRWFKSKYAAQWPITDQN